MSWHHRRRHARLLNAIASVVDRMEMYTRMPLNVTAMSVVSGVWLLVYYVFTFSSMVVFGQEAISGREVVYYLLLNGAICTVFAAVLQVRDLVGLLADVQTACVETLTVVVVDDEIGDQAVVLLSDVQRCAEDIMRCFGGHLLLCKARDFIFLTTIAFYIISEMAFKGSGPDWIMFHFMLTYLAPIVLNELLLVRAFGRLDRGMESFKRALSERKCLADERIGVGF